MSALTITAPELQTDPILPRVAEGDELAMVECMERYRGLVYFLAKRALGSSDDAEDVVQEVFLRLWKSADRFDASLSSEKSFVGMVTRRYLIDLRRKSERAPKMEPICAAENAESADLGTAASVETGEEAQRIRTALRLLEPERSRILEWSLCDGLTHRAIAEKIGISLGTVKSHARRGRLYLRKILEETTTLRPAAA